MKKAQYDLPLDSDPSAKFVPWIIALTTFLAMLLILITSFLSSVVGQWSLELSGKITLQLPATKNKIKNGYQAEKRAALITYLKSLPQVQKIKVIEQGKVASLLEPWLGERELLSTLPLPVLITLDIKANNPTPLNLRGRATLSSAVR